MVNIGCVENEEHDDEYNFASRNAVWHQKSLNRWNWNQPFQIGHEGGSWRKILHLDGTLGTGPWQSLQTLPSFLYRIFMPHTSSISGKRDAVMDFFVAPWQADSFWIVDSENWC